MRQKLDGEILHGFMLQRETTTRMWLEVFLSCHWFLFLYNLQDFGYRIVRGVYLALMPAQLPACESFNDGGTGFWYLNFQFPDRMCQLSLLSQAALDTVTRCLWLGGVVVLVLGVSDNTREPTSFHCSHLTANQQITATFSRSQATKANSCIS